MPTVIAKTLPILLALLLAPPAMADAFYVCKKKGQPHYLTNSGGLASAKRKGYRCKKRMDFGDSEPAAAPTPRRRKYSSGGGATTTSAPARTPKRFKGPAGEAESFEPWIQEAAERYNVPAHLVRAVIRVESNFRPHVVSSAGAKGLMQLMPGTAAEMGVSDVFDPRQNIFGGTRYLRVLINQFKGDAKLAIAAYHAGPGIVSSRGEIPYKATKRYVKAVLTHFLKYRDGR